MFDDDDYTLHVTVLCADAMDHRIWNIEQVGDAWHVLRAESDGTFTVMATADDEDYAFTYVMVNAGLFN